MRGRLAIFLLLTVQALFVAGQFFPAKIYSTSDGMPANKIHGIEQTDDGIMWFLTSRGVVTYNSQSWYLFPDSLGLPTSDFSGMMRDAANRIWVAGENDEGFVIKYFENGSWFETDKPDEWVASNQSFTFYARQVGDSLQVLISSGKKLYYKKIGQEWVVKEISFRLGSHINVITEIDGQIWLGSDEGVYTLNGDYLYKRDYRFPVNDNILNIESHNESIYLLGLNWMGRIDDRKIEVLSEDLGIIRSSRYNKNNLEIDKRGRIFYSAHTPAKYLDVENRVGKPLFFQNRIKNALSTRIFIDKEENVWIGDHRGLFKFNLLKFQSYDGSSGIYANEVSTIMETASGEIILANPRALNFISPTGNIRIYPFQDEKYVEYFTRINDICEDYEGRILMATSYGGLLVFDGGRFYPFKGFEVGGRTVVSVKNFNNKILVASSEGLFDITDGDKKSISPVKNIRNLVPLSGNELAVLRHYNGLVIYNDSSGVFREYRSDSRKRNSIYSAVKWNGDYLFASAGGILRLKNDSLVLYSVPEIPDWKAIYSLMVDATNSLWVGTSDGVYKTDGRNTIYFGESDGLIGKEVNRNAMIQDQNGDIWIGTELGASVYNQEEDLTLRYTPRLSITGIETTSGKTFEPESDSPVQIDSDENTLTFRFLGISFIDEQSIQYEYFLEGFDEAWQQSSTPQVRYINLPGGDYSFGVRSKVGKSEWSEPVFASIRIEQPLTEKPEFTLFLIFFAAIFVYSIYRFRVRYLINKQKDLESIIMLRTNELRELNKDLELKVADRTKHLENTNSRLREYAYINAHLLRAPLSRIQSLIYLIEISDKNGFDPKYYEILKDSSAELDQVIHSINDVLDDRDFLSNNQ